MFKIDDFQLAERAQQLVDDHLLYPHHNGIAVRNFFVPLQTILAERATSLEDAFAIAQQLICANDFEFGGPQAVAQFDDAFTPFVAAAYESFRSSLDETAALAETTQLVHHLCTTFFHACQPIPLTITYGTNTSRFGRLLIAELLNHYKRARYPQHVFTVKYGINFRHDDDNFDLYQRALQVRFPHFAFGDAPFHLPYADDHAAYMIDGTRVIGNRYGAPSPHGRGQICSSTINLVRLALRADGHLDTFYQRLQTTLVGTVEQLLARLNFEANQPLDRFPTLYSNGMWRDGDSEYTNRRLKHGTLNVNFVGLAEALIALCGQHHGDDDYAWQTGYNIVEYMRRYLDEIGDLYRLHFTLGATALHESLFIDADRTTFGTIARITDQASYCANFQLPRQCAISLVEKVKREAPFHALCNGGHYMRVSLAGHNLTALDTLVRTMARYGVGFGSIDEAVL